jgi:hypothetical protein
MTRVRLAHKVTGFEVSQQESTNSRRATTCHSPRNFDMGLTVFLHKLTVISKIVANQGMAVSRETLHTKYRYID